MALPSINFTTGPSVLPDVGLLSYNGCVFSPLFVTRISGKAIKDDAKRTVKYMEYVITADGYVTLSDGAASISPTMANLRRLLEAQGGALAYKGRGCDLVINPQGSTPIGAGTSDVAWGPVPEVLEFQPLGGGLSAKVVWQVTVRIPEVSGTTITSRTGGLAGLRLLQFCYETVVTYNEDWYTTLSVRGSLEVAMTRFGSQGNRKVTATVDDARAVLDSRIFASIDMTKFRVTKRNFPVSMDRRILTWDVSFEELPHMGLPPDCTVARGTYSFRPARAGPGLALWLCTLRATYTVRKGAPRRVAWFAFLAMLRERIRRSVMGVGPVGGNANPNVLTRIPAWFPPPFVVNRDPPINWAELILAQSASIRSIPGIFPRRAWLMDFSGEEGLYLDSKTISFSATWKISTQFEGILRASGLWSRVPSIDRNGGNLWVTTMGRFAGSQSWIKTPLDPNLDFIVDFGGN